MLRAKDGQKKQSRARGVAAAAVALLAAPTADAGVQFKSYQTHSHVVFSVDPDVSYSVAPILDKANNKTVGLKVVLDNVREELDDLTGSSDSRTDKVMVVKTPTVNGKQVIYQFILNEKAVKAGIEFFDYRSKVPAEIALDYWLKPQAAGQAKGKGAGASGAGLKMTKAESRAQAARNKAAADARAALAAKAAKPLFGGCGQHLDIQAEGVGYFKVYHRPYDYRGFFHLMPADSEYNYPRTVIGATLPELQHYRLALNLYREGQYALTLRTIEFFEQKYPGSPPENEIRFLKASTLMRLGDKLLSDAYVEAAYEIYRQVVLEEPTSERARVSLEFLVQEQMSRGVPVLALEYALMGAEQKPELFKNAKAPTVFRLASAEALYALGEYDRAERAYLTLVEQGGGRFAPEGAFRLGEVMSARQYWDRAIIYYEKALRDFPKDAPRFPTVYFNLAEANFRMGRFAEAERYYKEFDRLYGSDDPASWAAHLRLAELEQIKIKGTEPKKHETIADLYESVVNRHPFSAGAVMAELRLARCFKSLGAEDRTRAFFENFFSARDRSRLEDELVDPIQVGQWMDLTQAMFYLNNGEPRKALSQADEYRPKLGRTPLADSFRETYNNATVALIVDIAKKIRERRIDSLGPKAGGGPVPEDNGSHELLAAAEHYGDFVSPPAPIEYELAIARETLAVGDLGKATELINALTPRISGAAADERDDYHLLKARQLQYLGEKPDRILSELSDIRDDGPLAAWKVEEQARVATERGELKAAAAFDARIFNTELGRKLPVGHRIASAIRRIDNLERAKEYQEAARAADEAAVRFGMETQYPRLLARLKELRAQALYDAGDYKNAVEAIDDILSQSPDHPRHTEFEFMRGKGLAKLGRENEALETFTKLAKAAPTDDVWRKSAQAELDQLQWENKVSNQIKDRRSSQ